MSLYLFISAPADPTKQDAVSKLNAKIASKAADFAEVIPFALPEFKVGTLDSLVVLSDDLAKLDTTTEGIAVKIAENMRSLLGNDIDQWKVNLTVNDKSIDSYMRNYTWNTMKYRVDKSLREIADTIMTEVNQIDTLMKTKMANYSTVKAQLQGFQRKQTGNLAVRNIADVVKKEYFVLDSEYLQTVVVAVPKSLQSEWIASYEQLTQMVVPRSSQKIAEDDEYTLYTVTLFQRVLEDFAHKAREMKFTVRDFKWDAEAMSAQKKALAEAGATEKEQWTTLLRLCKANYGEVHSCWIHLKALRVFVESILRYGLPPDFQPMLIKPKPKQDRKVRDLLNAHYARLAGAAGSKAGDEALEENLQTLLGDKDYSPVVLFSINTVL
ncbi:ATPase, V1 complex, subunit C [Blyttiomyces helicus]|uniref:V-type proton ATPase subunit C n=1 Tax=Blyttiomyces helicus TaxID=388810 RepID=A0A4P9WA02_9FUNG|nr:ATPase, V1 complex, subunit C [Blyttiomyces helicus]|eukprot:RKO89032.1 ATPase, V1 complex, subunit C [Blyttiomyces helicus]